VAAGDWDLGGKAYDATPAFGCIVISPLKLGDA
jgi:hypothetical protein